MAVGAARRASPGRRAPCKALVLLAYVVAVAAVAEPQPDFIQDLHTAAQCTQTRPQSPTHLQLVSDGQGSISAAWREPYGEACVDAYSGALLHAPAA